jgi:hypothetical protein
MCSYQPEGHFDPKMDSKKSKGKYFIYCYLKKKFITTKVLMQVIALSHSQFQITL